MVVNDSLVLQVLHSFSEASIGVYINQVLYMLGGLAGATCIYFISVVYYQRKILKKHERELELLEYQLLVLIEQYKMIKEMRDRDNRC